MFKLYQWLLPKKGDFLQQFEGDEDLYNLALSMWSSLESSALYFILIFAIVGLLGAIWYYYAYTQIHGGRKWRVGHWFIWFAVVYFLTSAATLIIGDLIVNNGPERMDFLVRISLFNGIYALGIYFLLSLVACNIPLHTNAYRFLQFKKAK